MLDRIDRRLARVIKKTLDSKDLASSLASEGGLPVTVVLSGDRVSGARAISSNEKLETLLESETELKNVNDWLLTTVQAEAAETVMLPFSNAVRTRLSIPQVEELCRKFPAIKILRHSPEDKVISLDDSVPVVKVPQARQINPKFTGSGIRIAVIDSGADADHPHLSIRESLSFHPEDKDSPGKPRPGRHGTHVAGIIASKHPAYGGVVPDVDIINLKAFSTGGVAQPMYVVNAIQEACRRKVDIINLSAGWSPVPGLGHNWDCPDGDCELCRAANAATELGVLVVAAAGNERQNAEYMRRTRPELHFPTEITCPGNAAGVLTVGSVTKSLTPANSSSQGPGTSSERTKPNLVAPGHSITSTVPGGGVAPESGTSMATPHVSALAAAVIYQLKSQGRPAPPILVKSILMRTTDQLGLPMALQGQGMVNAMNIASELALRS